MWSSLALAAFLLVDATVFADQPWADARPLAVGPVRVLTGAPRARAVVELAADIAASFANPFDVREIAVDADIAGPDGVRWTQPGFFDLPYTRSGPGGIQAGPGGWRIRFTPPAAGTWRVV